MSLAAGAVVSTIAGSALIVYVPYASVGAIRSRVQRVVDRRFNRARYDAQRTIQGFADRLRDELDLGTLSLALERTAAEAIEPSSTAVWLLSRASAR